MLYICFFVSSCLMAILNFFQFQLAFGVSYIRAFILARHTRCRCSLSMFSVNPLRYGIITILKFDTSLTVVLVFCSIFFPIRTSEDIHFLWVRFQVVFLEQSASRVLILVQSMRVLIPFFVLKSFHLNCGFRIIDILWNIFFLSENGSPCYLWRTFYIVYCFQTNIDKLYYCRLLKLPRWR